MNTKKHLSYDRPKDLEKKMKMSREEFLKKINIQYPISGYSKGFLIDNIKKIFIDYKYDTSKINSNLEAIEQFIEFTKSVAAQFILSSNDCYDFLLRFKNEVYFQFHDVELLYFFKLGLDKDGILINDFIEKFLVAFDDINCENTRSFKLVVDVL